MLVNEITQITAHDWNAVHSTVIKDSLLHNHPQLSRIASIKASAAAIAIASDRN